MLIELTHGGSARIKNLNVSRPDEIIFKFFTDRFRCWAALCSQVASFCQEMGSLSVSRNPLEDIQNLKTYAASQGSRTREAALEIENRKLAQTCREQHRVITNLKFRYLLENLPGPKPTNAKGNPTATSTGRWKAFWTDAWTNAQKQGSSGSHPLSPLLQKFDNNTQKQVEAIGKGLFGCLSTNIHHCGGEIEVIDDQWNVIDAAILRAITPLETSTKPDGSVDWDKERQRYLIE